MPARTATDEAGMPLWTWRALGWVVHHTQHCLLFCCAYFIVPSRSFHCAAYLHVCNHWECIRPLHPQWQCVLFTWLSHSWPAAFRNSVCSVIHALTTKCQCYAQFTSPARHGETVLFVSCQAVWTESRDRLAKSEQLADRSPSSRGV